MTRADVERSSPGSRGGGSRASTPPEAPVYYPYFDWLRIILAAAVMLSHSAMIPWVPTGNFCVQVFFALSGWLIGGILLRTDREGMPRFYFLRGTRIWIPYAVALALLLAVSLLRDPVTPKYLEFIFYKATFVYNLFGTDQIARFADQMPLHSSGNHFWSICAEEQFYLVAPILLVLWPKWGRSIALWIVLILGLLWVGLYGAISLGVLAAMLQQRFGPIHRKPPVRAAFVIFVLVAFPLVVLEKLPYDETVPFISIATVLALAEPGTKRRLAGWLGGVSYPLYLNHWLGMFVAHSVLKRLGVLSHTADGLVGAVFGFAVSAVLYELVDRQILKRRDGWFTRDVGKRFAITAYTLTLVGLIGGLVIRYGHLTPQPNDPVEPAATSPVGAELPPESQPIPKP